MKALIGSGFHARDAADFDAKFQFFKELWLPRFGGRDIVIVDNSEPPVPKLCQFETLPNLRIIPVMKNLGHVHDFLGKRNPKLGGWSMSWVITAQIAYCEGRDFIYCEADMLPFGDWEESILGDMANRNLLAAFGYSSPYAACEQSLFFIKHKFILDFIQFYISMPMSDGQLLPEDKFIEMMNRYTRIGNFSLPFGRNRPLDFGLPSWFAQKLTAEELAELKERKLV